MAIASAAITAGAGLAAGRMSSLGQSSANAENRKLAMQQMAFQQFMASHAHGIEMNDLRRSGLNPILTATGGHGAATPSGSSAVMQNVKGAGVDAALQALTTISTALLTKQQADKTKAETENTIARTATERQQPGLVQAQTNLAASQGGLTDVQAANALAMNRQIEAETKLKTIGAQVSASEILKNQAATDLLRKQGMTQDQITQLQKTNVLQATEILKGLTNQGNFDHSAYGQWLYSVHRTLSTIGIGTSAAGDIPWQALKSAE